MRISDWGSDVCSSDLKRGDDAECRVKLRELAQQRRRFGYRRLHILLRRDGVTINRKKTQRLYREEGLAVRRRRNRRRAVGTKAPAPVLALPNHDRPGGE